jgi:hypothetical protein
MAVISSSDLKYHYSWTVIPGDNPKVTGNPDNTLLNRNEGYEMLYFVNKFCERYNLTTVSGAQKVERMIKTVVPSHVHSQISIDKWIYDNWKNH